MYLRGDSGLPVENGTADTPYPQTARLLARTMLFQMFSWYELVQLPMPRSFPSRAVR